MFDYISIMGNSLSFMSCHELHQTEALDQSRRSINRKASGSVDKILFVNFESFRVRNPFTQLTYLLSFRLSYHHSPIVTFYQNVFR